MSVTSIVVCLDQMEKGSFAVWPICCQLFTEQAKWVFSSYCLLLPLCLAIIFLLPTLQSKQTSSFSPQVLTKMPRRSMGTAGASQRDSSRSSRAVLSSIR